ncbi:Rieske (2Fe-2S) protein [Pelobium sp.]|nr:Rieske (2Fe-2S) protein [Pelobium sp.]MDA9555655.1 Rieske (2Fe-2S) protein [Pelobium sp.]
MERQEFLKQLGISFAVVCAGSCLSACGGKGDTGTPSNSNQNPPPPGAGNTVSVDVSTKLVNVGDQTTMNGVLFIRTASGNSVSSFVATEAICPHQGGSLVWINNQNKIQCQLHQSEYSINGSVTQGPQNTTGSTRALKIYATTISGNILTATVV